MTQTENEKNHRWKNAFALLISLTLLAGCAVTSPMREVGYENHTDGMDALQIFEASFQQHGGEHLKSLKDVNVAVDGEWQYLITRIQPLVTDEAYRQQSEERIVLSPRLYAANYRGEAGTKQVLRSAESIQVGYEFSEISGREKLSASALTADAFYLFTLGPLALVDRVDDWQRLKDGEWDGRSYYRINGELTPGIGVSNSDFITLWIDKETLLTFRLHITLDGFESTVGAHVDTSFLNYTTIDHFTFPTHFFERVLGPIRIDAHEWWYTGIDINRGLTRDDLGIEGWSEKASNPAAKWDGRD
jgi:hypothetical protein